LRSDDYDSTLTKNDSVKLARAIQSFQRKHGLNADGKIGKNTLLSLNETTDEHIHHLEMNMERWRWEKPVQDERYVWINIPSYTFWLIDTGVEVLKSRIICGAPDKQSPELNSTVNYFIIYPYWNIPFSIATKELLPAIQRDTGYLRKHNIDVLDHKNNVVDPAKIKWKKFNEKKFPYKLRQRDGDENTLGVLKFIFPNPFGVYLHDTNARNLFRKEIRALSHGCFRLEKAKEFAEYLVQSDTLLFTVDSLHYYLQQKVQKRVPVTPHLPVQIRYFTCEADDNGVIFYNDVYLRDEKMIRELYHQKMKSDTSNAVLPL
jgi:murein L,D-transpeptidase YcbB/YkuD